MRKLVSFMHVSLDGFVTNAKGEMNWIRVDQEIFDYAGERTNASDLALYGRVTFDMMQGYWPNAGKQPNASKHDIEHSAWYNKVAKVVVSKSLKGKSIDNTRIISDNLAEEIKKVKSSGSKEIVIFGSSSATQALMKENLIDEFWLFVNPVLLGDGKRFFPQLQQMQNLKLVKSHSFASGVVCLHYEKASS